MKERKGSGRIVSPRKSALSPGGLPARTSGVRAYLPRKFADLVSKKKPHVPYLSLSLSLPHPLLSIHERCLKRTGGSLLRLFGFLLVLPHNPDHNNRKV